MAYQPTGNPTGRPKQKQVFVPTTFDSLTGADRLTALRTTRDILARNLIEANPTQAPNIAKRFLAVWELLDAAEVKTVIPKHVELALKMESWGMSLMLNCLLLLLSPLFVICCCCCKVIFCS